MQPDVSLLAAGALEWLVASARAGQIGPVWGDTRSDAELDPTLYSGAAGIIVSLLEAYRHFGDDRYADTATKAGRQLAVDTDGWEHCSLYFGLTGMAVVLDALHEVTGDAQAGLAATHVLHRVRARFDGERWGDQFELLGGNAGIALGALQVGDLDLAVTAVTPYRHTAEPTPGGTDVSSCSPTGRGAGKAAPGRAQRCQHGL